MSLLLVLWQPDEMVAVEMELEKLFALQDRPFPKEKKAIFVNELGVSGMPAKAVIAGIKRLQTEDLKQIKLQTVLEATRACLDPRSMSEVVPCDHCFGCGTVTMVDEQKYRCALQCICQNGDRIRGLLRWNGQLNQESRKRWLTLEFDTVGQKTKVTREW